MGKDGASTACVNGAGRIRKLLTSIFKACFIPLAQTWYADVRILHRAICSFRHSRGWGHQPDSPRRPLPFLPSQVANASEKSFLLRELSRKHQQLPGLDLVSAEEQLYTSQFISASERGWLPCSLLQTWVSEGPFQLILRGIFYPLHFRVLVSYSPQCAFLSEGC